MESVSLRIVTCICIMGSGGMGVVWGCWDHDVGFWWGVYRNCDNVEFIS